MAIVTRIGKGSELTYTEMDDNLKQIPNGADSSITDTGNGNVNIDANGVGIGTSSPDAPLHVVGDLNYVSALNGNGTITLSSDDHGNAGFDASPSIVFEAPYSADTANTVRVPYAIIEGRKESSSGGNTAGFLSFSTSEGGSAGTSERMRITNNGITFNGDTAAANALDDYEEGTWTPTALNYDGTMTVNYADYTKIGRLVYATASVTYDGTADGSGISWGGVPFSLKVNEMGYQGGFIVHDSSGNLSSVSYRSTNNLYGRNSSGAIPSYTTVGAATVIFTVIFSTDS